MKTQNTRKTFENTGIPKAPGSNPAAVGVGSQTWSAPFLLSASRTPNPYVLGSIPAADGFHTCLPTKKKRNLAQGRARTKNSTIRVSAAAGCVLTRYRV